MSTESESSRKEIVALKEEMHSIRSEREKHYNERKQIGKQIAELIASVKEKRSKRNNLTDSVKDSKEKRKVFNKEIREKIAQIKKLKDKKMGTASQGKVDPIRLKKEIETLEYKVETEGMSFTNEQKTMKLIKEKQKQYEEVKDISEVYKGIKTLSKEIAKLKKEADKHHATVQTQATDSQKEHEEILDISKKIDELKKSEKEAHEKYLKAKEEYQKVNKKFKALAKEQKDIIIEDEDEGDFDDDADLFYLQDEEPEPVKKESFKEQVENVNEKIKKNKKLTTEDLMLMQKAEMKK